MYLRDVGDAGRQLPGEGPHVAAVQRDGAGVALQAAQQAAEEGALAGTLAPGTERNAAGTVKETSSSTGGALG